MKRRLKYALTYLDEQVDLNNESVAFLKPKGGAWFKTLKSGLSTSGNAFVEITRAADWPSGPENIALCTMSSAKGLEFDHVIILGLNAEVTEHGSEPDDTDLHNLRRLLAMAITRARKSVIVGYKPGEASELIKYLDKSTFQEVTL